MFIGRARELRILEELMSSSAGTIAALISGVAGSGKSRLLAEARSLAPGSTVLSITGFESEHQVPLAAAGPLLRRLGRVPSHGEALDTLLVGRTANPRTTGPALDGGALEPLRIFEAAHRALQAIGPAVLIFDDLQWVDELSRALFHFLIRGAVETRQPLVVLAATRPGLGAEYLLDSLPAESIHLVELGPMDHADALALVRTVNPALDHPAAAKLCTQAQGIPFWLEGLARYGRSPGGLEQVLTRRLRGAGAEAATVLGALALAGRPFPLGEAADLLELPSGRVAAAIDALAERGLVTSIGGAALPAHDLVRATAAAQLPDKLRRTIHARLATRLESEAGNDTHPLRVALEHRRAAGLPLVALAIRLSTASDRRLLAADGLAALGAMADAADPLDPETIALHAAVAALAHELGRHEEALWRWSLVAARAGEPRDRATAALEASRAAYALDRPDEARALLERSRDLAEADAVLALEQATQDAAIALWLERRGPEARELAAHSVAMARRLDPGGHRDGATPERRAILGALRVGYEATMQEGDPQALLPAAEEREIAARGVGLEEQLESELALAVALRQNGRAYEALTHLRRVWDDTRRAVLPRLTVDAGFWLGRTLMMTGALEEAEAVVDEALDLAGRVGDVPRARHRIARVAAGVWFERGRTEEAVTILERDLGGEANEHQRIILHGERATWAARLHADAAAEIVRSHLEAARACAAAVDCPRCSAELLQMATEASARAGNPRAARQSIRRRGRIRISIDALDQILFAHARALALPTPGARIHALQAAATAAGASQYRLLTLWARLDLGRAYASVGDRRAVPELERVVAAANESGAVTVRELAARALRSLGVRTWRRAATGSVLTPREQEVARLVAAGVTNREAADRLFLSPKTVERHLVNLFRKLEVRNRTELASRLAEVDAKRTGFPR